MRIRHCSTSSREVTRRAASAFCMSGIVASTTVNGVGVFAAGWASTRDTAAQDASRASSGFTVSSWGFPAARAYHAAQPASAKARMTKTLAPCDVHVWYRLTEALSPDELAACRSLLSAEERLRCERFVFERDRRDFAAAHALLRHTLSLYGDRGPA